MCGLHITLKLFIKILNMIIFGIKCYLGKKKSKYYIKPLNESIFPLFWYRTISLEEVHTAFSIATAIQQCWIVAHNIYEISLISKFVSSWKNIVSLRRTYDTSNSKVLFKKKTQKIRNKTPNFQNLTSICLKEKNHIILLNQN